jgi:hypothetical protein
MIFLDRRRPDSELGQPSLISRRMGDDLHGLELVRTVAAPQVTHLKFARR